MPGPVITLSIRRVTREAGQLVWLAVLSGIAGSALVVTQAIAAGGSDVDIGGAGVLAVVIGAVVISVAFGLVWRTRMRDVAQLRALGASRGQIRRVLLGEALLIGLVGAGLAVAFGRVAAEGAARYRDIPIAFRTDDLIGAGAVSLIGCLLAAVVASAKAARVEPIRLLRGETGGPRRAWGRLALGAVAIGLFVQQFRARQADENLNNTNALLILGVAALATVGPLLTAATADLVSRLTQLLGRRSAVNRVMSLARVELVRDLPTSSANSSPISIAALLMTLPLFISAMQPDDPTTQVEYNRNFDTVLLLISVVVVLGLMVSAALSLRQRRPVLGMLRAIGATQADLRAVVCAQAAIGALVGGLAGIVLGGVCAWSSSGRDVQFVVPYLDLALLLGTLVVIPVISVALIATAQLRQDPLYALAAARAE